MSKLSRLYQGQTNIDFIGKRRRWFAISGLFILASLLALGTKGLNYGIQFKGGVSIQAPVAADGPLGNLDDTGIVSALGDELGGIGVTDATIQVASEGDADRTVLVQTKEAANAEEQERVIATVREAVGASDADTDSSRIGSKWGGEITDKAVRALFIFMIVVLAFISWRFEWKMAIGALVAMIHDLIITAGIYSVVGFEVTPSTVIAILTILGYSLYDTVVVFDKVEENTNAFAATGKMTYQDSANLAMNQVFMRSLNTSLATLLPVAALLFVGAGFLGAGTLKDLSLALFVGIMTGSYSSVFVATPILSMMKEREPKYKNTRAKLLRDSTRRTAAPVAATAGAGDGDPVSVSTSARPISGSRPAQARPRAGSKKAARRKKR